MLQTWRPVGRETAPGVRSLFTSAGRFGAGDTARIRPRRGPPVAQPPLGHDGGMNAALFRVGLAALLLLTLAGWIGARTTTGTARLVWDNLQWTTG